MDDEKKKRLLICVVVAFVVAVGFMMYVFSVTDSSGEEQQQEQEQSGLAKGVVPGVCAAQGDTTLASKSDSYNSPVQSQPALSGLAEDDVAAMWANLSKRMDEEKAEDEDRSDSAAPSSEAASTPEVKSLDDLDKLRTNINGGGSSSGRSSGGGSQARPAAPKKKEEPKAKPDRWAEWENGDAVSANTTSEGAPSPAGVADADKSYSCMFIQAETLKSGQRVMIRCLDEIALPFITIPANSYLAATAQITSSRMDLLVTGYQVNGEFYMLNLVAYDIDGNRGLYCPEAAEIIKRAAQQGNTTGRSVISDLVRGVAGNTIGTIAGTALDVGGDALNNALSKVTINVPNGYRFFLRVKKENN